jgi:glutaredoxin 3
MAKIIIYSIPNCPYCSELKELLINENIEFVDIDVSLPENDKEFERIHKITNSDEVPVISVGKQLLVPNVSFKSIQESFELTKKFLL